MLLYLLIRQHKIMLSSLKIYMPISIYETRVVKPINVSVNIKWKISYFPLRKILLLYILMRQLVMMLSSVKISIPTIIYHTIMITTIKKTKDKIFKEKNISKHKINSPNNIQDLLVMYWIRKMHKNAHQLT